MLKYFLLLALVSFVCSAPVEQENEHSIKKRQIGAIGMMPGLIDTYDFLRPSTGLWAGALGGYRGSLIFGPPLMGPFNNPNRRLERIIQIFDQNRLLNNKPTMEQQFRLPGNFEDTQLDDLIQYDGDN